MNTSKHRDPRFWARWKKAGAVATIQKKSIQIRRPLSVSQRRLDSNEFVYGCANPVHVHGVGYIDPSDRYSARYLDP